MSIFSELPSVEAVLDTEHEDAAGLIHAWLFNAGSGTAVKDYVDNNDGTLASGYGSWAAGGGFTFNDANARLSSAVMATISVPWTLVAGVEWTSVSGYQAIMGHWGAAAMLGNNGASMYVYGMTADKWYVDGSEYASAQAISAATHVVGYHVHTCPDIVTSGSYKLEVGNDGWSEYFRGRIAFVYIYAGETDSALQARLASNPYAMFGEGGDDPWPALLTRKKPHALVRR